MPQLTTTVEIAAGADVVFRWLIEPDRLARWIRGFESSEALTEGGARLGARSRDTLREGGRSLVAETEIVAFEPDRLMKVRIEAGGMHSLDTYRLAPRGSGTELTYTSDVQLTGGMRLMTPLIGRQLRARAERDLATLKREVESGH